MTVIKLKPRILLPFVLVGLSLLGFLLYSIFEEENAHIDQEFITDIGAIQEVYTALNRDHAAKMSMALNFITQNEQMKSAFLAADRKRLFELSAPLFQQLQHDYQITHFYFHDSKRVNFLRVHQPPRYGDTIDRFSALSAERSGITSYGQELGPLGTFTLRVVTPWYEHGELLGYLELGEEVEDLLKELSTNFHVEIVLLMDKQYLERRSWEAGMRMLGREADWDLLPEAVVPYRTLPISTSAQLPLLSMVKATAVDELIDININDRRYRSGQIPLRDAGNRMVGSILIMRDVSERITRVEKTIRHSGLLALGAGSVLFALFYVILAGTERQMSKWQQQLVDEGKARTDIQEKHIKDLERLALYDSLTELPNRKLLLDRIEFTLKQAQRNDEPFALIQIDLQRMREVNDTLGHDAGDQIIKQVSKRLSDGLRDTDTVARAEGAEFSVLMPTIDLERAVFAAEKVQQLLSVPFEVNGISVDIGAAVGIALYPEHGSDASTLVRRADVAMRHAKGTLKGYAVYESEADPYSIRRLTLFGDLRKAIANGSLELHYQPQLSMHNSSIEAVEALTRWRHPTLGPISPLEFVPLAEHTGLIRPFTTWVLNEAMGQCRRWADKGIDISVAVNLSARNLLDSALPEQIAELLEKWQLDTRHLHLEITESAIMHEPERSMAVLQKLNQMGLAIIIDDFGTGYSSLAYLKQLPVVELKIDKSFVLEMLHEESDATIVSSTIGLAHNLGLSVVAEGVESKEVMTTLSTQGCDVIQGYFISRPLPADEFEAWLGNAPWVPRMVV